MKLIKIWGEKNKGKFLIVDDEDVEKIICYGHRVSLNGIGRPQITVNGSRKYIYHLLIECPKGKVIDHINGSVLDNRKENLRICSFQENLQNQRKHKFTTTRYKGIYFDPKRKSFKVQIGGGEQGRTCFLGWFPDEKEAAYVYDQAAMQIFGEFACTNFQY